MVSQGQIKLKKLKKMLEACAPGYTITAKTHKHWVQYKGLTFRSLPLGGHGRRHATSLEIEIGHIRKMIRFLDIDLECAKSQLPQL